VSSFFSLSDSVVASASSFNAFLASSVLGAIFDSTKMSSASAIIRGSSDPINTPSFGGRSSGPNVALLSPPLMRASRAPIACPAWFQASANGEMDLELFVPEEMREEVWEAAAYAVL
jgi:hypothetical protein